MAGHVSLKEQNHRKDNFSEAHFEKLQPILKLHLYSLVTNDVYVRHLDEPGIFRDTILQTAQQANG